VGEAFVSLDTIINVLRRNKIQVSEILSADGSPTDPRLFAVAKGDPMTMDYVFEVILLPLPVRKKLLNYVARKWGVPIHQFYNPLMAPRLPDEKIQ
jgi:hypothetical protein